MILGQVSGFALDDVPSFCCVFGCSSYGTFYRGLAFPEFPSEQFRHVGPSYIRIVPGLGSTKVCSIYFREENFCQRCVKTLARDRKNKEGGETEGVQCKVSRVYRVHATS